MFSKIRRKNNYNKHLEKTRPRLSKGATNRSTVYNRRYHRNTR
ncbi:MAG: hypothetical protein V8S91_02380 [Romboutsia timonensis]